MNIQKLNSPAGQRPSRRIKGPRFKFVSFLLLLTGIESVLLTAPVGAAMGTCGNGVVDKFEQCDDGNLNNGDGCSSLCQKEGENFQVMVYTANDPLPRQPRETNWFHPEAPGPQTHPA